MSVYISGMELPTSCPCELLGIGYDLYCSFAAGIPARVKEYYECCQNGTRPSWCPLVPVQPHGDLIDRDALLDTATIHWSQTTNESCFPIDEIEYAPTIIEADKVV